jgi:hypothetical protein
MVDYVSSFTKKLKKHKVIVGIAILIFVIILIANFMGFFSPTSLDIKIYNWEIIATHYNDDETAVIGLNSSFPIYITNTGRVPIHIVAVDVFAKPIRDVDEVLSEIAYLKPEENFSYTFTEYFDVSLPLNGTSDQLFQQTDYALLVMYTENSNRLGVKSVWTEVLHIVRQNRVNYLSSFRPSNLIA